MDSEKVGRKRAFFRHLFHLRTLGLCVAAVFAVAALTASSAMAGKPEWGKCVAKAGGKYSDGGCTTKAKGGSFEWEKAAAVKSRRESESKPGNVPFTGGSVGSSILTTGGLGCEGPNRSASTWGFRVPRHTCIEGGAEPEYAETGVNVECSGENNSGETSGKNGVTNVHVAFTGCTIFGLAPCQSTGAKEGEVVINQLKGELGYINKSTKEVGVRLEPTVKHAPFVEFECSNGGGFGVATTVGAGNKKEGAFYLTGGCFGACPTATSAEEKKGGNDQIISPITPVNTMTSTFEQVYKVNANHENIPNKLEGKAISLLEDHFVVNPELSENPSEEGSMWSPAGEEITNVNTPEEEGEIKA